jgi:membrane protease YdiL (CAAX protease family)
MVLWRVGFRWYLFAFLGIPAIMVLSVIFLPGVMASFQGLAIEIFLPFLGLAPLSPLPLLVLFIYIFFLGGAQGEEPGWRGFALPRLQRRYGPFVGSLILGPLWAMWHLPVFWVPAWNYPPTLLNIVMFVIAAIAFTIVMTWVFNNTKGSVFLAVLVHATFDLYMALLNGLFPTPLVNDYGSNVPRSHLINTRPASWDLYAESIRPLKRRENATRSACRVGPSSSFPIYEMASS